MSGHVEAYLINCQVLITFALKIYSNKNTKFGTSPGDT